MSVPMMISTLGVTRNPFRGLYMSENMGVRRLMGQGGVDV
jgi:hypothetical protein